MLIDDYNSNNINQNILQRNESFRLKKKLYYETAIKNKSNNNFFIDIDSNTLINALRNFSVKYELEDKKIFKEYKFVILFDELISLIRYSLESQKKLYEYEQDEDGDIKNFTHDFINTISNYINSYEKVEKINPASNLNMEMKSSTNKENISINSYKDKTRKSLNIIKSPSCKVDIKKTKIKKLKKKPTLNKTKNYHTNLKSNKSTINTNNNNNTINPTNINKKIEDNNNNIQETKYYFKRKNYQKLSSIFSPVKIVQTKNQFKKESNIRINKSAERRHIKTSFTSHFQNKESLKKINPNKSIEKRHKNISEKKTENKPLSTYTLGDFLKSSSFILKNKNKSKEFNTQGEKSSNDIKRDYSSNKDKKTVYYNQNMTLGVKKQYIKGNVPRPSNYANKLLQSGIKFITEFNGLKEEEMKKHY